MEENRYTVEGRTFRNQLDYSWALRDKSIMDKLREDMKGCDIKALYKIHEDLDKGKYPFHTLLLQDFIEEIQEYIAAREGNSPQKARKPMSKESKLIHKGTKKKAEKEVISNIDEEKLNEIAVAELKKQEKRRRYLILFCSLFGAACLGYFSLYSYFDYRTEARNKELSELKNKEIPNLIIPQETQQETVTVNLDGSVEKKEVLDEYKNLLIKNRKLIGWLKIDDTNIDYPVMQTSDNEYYQDHNLNQEYDKNGSIFMDKDCDVVKPSTNYILYGHHMKSGQMFGDLDDYESEKYYKEHSYIQFDTIYEKGLYQVMYVFRSRVYSEEEVIFKYYQFIDAISETEFNSYMQEMANMSLYETGVTAAYGDQLLTLSTCDYKEKNGRFVVVAKRVDAKE